MFRKYMLWNKINKELHSNNEFKLDSITKYFNDLKAFNIKDLNYIKDKLNQSVYLMTKIETKELIESINRNILKLITETNPSYLSNKQKLYDFDRYVTQVDNNDFKWYLSPRGYENTQTISSKEIEKMFLEVNKITGKNYIFNAKKSEYIFYELDYDVKKTILLYHQMYIQNTINAELKLIKKYNPELDANIEFNKYIDTKSLNELNKLFDRSSQLTKIEIDKLRKELTTYSKDSSEYKELLNEISKLHIFYNKRINLLTQSTKLLDTYYKHFLQESRWRIIDVISHLNKGKIYYFGEPLNGFWVWTISKDGQFNLGNREENMKGGYAERLPHSTIAQGQKVLGAGEVELIDGKINRFNSQSGHYYDITNPETYNLNCKNIFLEFSKKLHIKGKLKFTETLLS